MTRPSSAPPVPIIAFPSRFHIPRVSHPNMELANIKPDEGITLRTAPPENTASLQTIWNQAVHEYLTTARLSGQEKEILRQQDPYEALKLAKVQWQRNIVDKTIGPQDLIQRTVSQVLGVFDGITAALGLAQTVRQQFLSHG